MKIYKLNLIGASLMALSLFGCASSTLENPSLDRSSALAFEKAKLSENFIKGADISTLSEMEQQGYIYKDENGNAKDCLAILKDNGFNYIRLRLWNDPKDSNGNPYGAGNNDLATDIALAKRAKDLGLELLLDFHYSDFWTDPGKQFKPKEWDKLSFEELNEAIYSYSKNVIRQFKDAGVLPSIIQVGNEINSGILWPDGKSWGGDGHEFDRLATLLKSAIRGIKEESSNSRIMLHLAKGTDNGAFKWWFDEIVKREVPFDLIGMSMYTWWDGPISALEENIRWVESTYHKDVIVVEGSYPYTLRSEDSLPQDVDEEAVKKAGYAASVEGQYQYLRDLMEAIDRADGKGFFYWEAAWKTAQGISWASPAGMDYIKCGKECQMGNARENQALFDSDGRVLPSVKVFNN